MPWPTPSWMGRRSEWTSASPRELTPRHQVCTWADPLAPETVTMGAEEGEGEMTTTEEETDTDAPPVHTIAEGHHLLVQDTDTDLDPEATLHVAITEMSGWECFPTNNFCKLFFFELTLSLLYLQLNFHVRNCNVLTIM